MACGFMIECLVLHAVRVAQADHEDQPCFIRKVADHSGAFFILRRAKSRHVCIVSVAQPIERERDERPTFPFVIEVAR
jgi:hypothetical protein